MTMFDQRMCRLVVSMCYAGRSYSNAPRAAARPARGACYTTECEFYRVVKWQSKKTDFEKVKGWKDGVKEERVEFA